MSFKCYFLFIVLSLDEKSFFGTYASDISSLTSSLKYISEKHNNLLCFLIILLSFFFSFLHDWGFPAFSSSVRSHPGPVGAVLTAESALKVLVHADPDRQTLGQSSDVLRTRESLHNPVFYRTFTLFVHLKNAADRHMMKAMKRSISPPLNTKAEQATGVKPQLTDLLSRKSNFNKLYHKCARWIQSKSKAAAIRWLQTWGHWYQ